MGAPTCPGLRVLAVRRFEVGRAAVCCRLLQRRFAVAAGQPERGEATKGGAQVLLSGVPAPDGCAQAAL